MTNRLWRRSRRFRRAWRAIGRRGTLALAVLVLVAGLAPMTASAQMEAAPVVTVLGSSVVVVGQPLGSATITASRRDPLTGQPVVIGHYTGLAVPWLPFSVNTLAPTATDPAGDCWQQGMLESALTPDLRAGDTVTVTGATGPIGEPPAPTTITVGANDTVPTGPIPACAALAPFAENVITVAPQRVAGDAITVSGRAQPLATDVAITASDGTTTTPPATATPGGGGTWSATIPAADVARLADGALTLRPVIGVPDVETGEPAHIRAAAVTVQKGSAAPASDPAVAPADPIVGAGGPSTGGTPSLRQPVSGLRLAARRSLRSARARGIAASFVAPAGTATVQVQLLRAGRVLGTTTAAARPGTRQTVRLSSRRLRRLLRPGRYTLRVRAGASADQLGSPLSRGLVIH